MYSGEGFITIGASHIVLPDFQHGQLSWSFSKTASPEPPTLNPMIRDFATRSATMPRSLETKKLLRSFQGLSSQQPKLDVHVIDSTVAFGLPAEAGLAVGKHLGTAVFNENNTMIITFFSSHDNHIH